MTLSLIVAMSENRVIGVANDLPWHLPADLKYFKAQTLGKPIIMGRKTYESIGRPLPGRRNIVVTRTHDWAAQGVEAASSLEQAILLAEAGGAPEVMITGGAQIYAQAIDKVDRLYITEVALRLEGDSYFPDFDMACWNETRRETHAAQDGKPAYAFVVYDRV